MTEPLPPASRPGGFGPNVPLTILLATLLIVNGSRTIGLCRERARLAQAEHRFLQSDAPLKLAQAQGVAERLDALIRGLASLAPADANARRVLEEFRLPAAAKAAEFSAAEGRNEGIALYT